MCCKISADQLSREFKMKCRQLPRNGPFEKLEAFFAAEMEAFAFLGDLPQRMTYGNLKIAAPRSWWDPKLTGVFCEINTAHGHIW
jgi:hypothetical protein